MPLPNYGYFNKEDKKNQELLFESAPELVDEYDPKNPYMSKRKRAQITTGKMDIDVERKIMIDPNKDRDIWTRDVDPRNIEEARKYASPEREVLRRGVRSSIDSLISGDKLKEVRSARRPSIDNNPLSSYVDGVDDRAVRFTIPTPSGTKSGPIPPARVYRKSPMREETRTGVSIQPRGTFKMQQFTTKHQIKTMSSNNRGLY